MANSPVILWDYDDTLGGVRFPSGEIRPGAEAYFDCIERFAKYIDQVGLSGKRAKELQHEIDLELAKKHGFGDKTRFAQSFREAYLCLADEDGWIAQEHVMRQVYEIGMSVFTDYPYVALEGALDVLDKTNSVYRPVIVTKGERGEQLKKLDQAGVLGFVDMGDVFVVSKKNEQDWQYVLDTIGITTPEQARESWAIGNSMKADVNPLVERGFNGIHIAGKNAWTFEKADAVEPLEGRVLKVVGDITEVLDIVPGLPTFYPRIRNEY